MKQLTTILTAMLLFQCSIVKKNDLEVKQITFEKVTDEMQGIELECWYIPLETNKQNLIRAIKDIQIVDDRIFLLEESPERKLLVFDINGQFISQVGGIGAGPGEFNIPSQIHIDPDKEHLIIADLGKTQLLYYDLNNYKFLFQENTPDFSEIIWLHEECYASYLISGHDTGKRKRYYIMLNKGDAHESNLIDEVDFHSYYSFSIGRYSFSCNNEKRIIYPFDPVIREITPSGTRPVYEIQFGHGELPSMEWIIGEASNDQNYTRALTNSGKISAFTLSETNTHVQIIYLINKQFYIGFYDKSTNHGWDCSFLDFTRQTGLIGLSNTIGNYNDYFISYLYPQSFRYMSEMRNDLKPLAQKVSEEDNPILCLFKLK